MILSAALAAKPPPQIKSNTGLRGIAALLVVAYHLQLAGYRLPFKAITDIFDRSYLMVDLFFILSGFILTYVGGPKYSVNRTDYKNFLISRFIRIYPLHIFCLLYLVIIAGLADALLIGFGNKSIFGNWSADSLKLLLAQATLINGWFFTENGWNTPTWSISVEVIAYAVFPVLSVILTRFRHAAVVFLSISAVLYTFIIISHHNLDLIGGFAILRCLAGFIIGMMVCNIRKNIERTPYLILSVAQIATLILILQVTLFSINDLFIIPLFFALVYTTSNDRGILSNILKINVFNFLGKISYSIYLNHVCLLIIIQPIWSRLILFINRYFYVDNLCMIPVFFIVLIMISAVTYHRIELPIGRSLNSRWRARSLAPLSQTPSAP